MKDGEVQFGVQLLLADRREYPDAAVADFDNCFADLSLVVANLDPVQAVKSHFGHFVPDRVVTRSSETVNAGAQEEVSAGVGRSAEQFIDVPLAISNMHKLLRPSDQPCRLLQIFQPTIALLFFDRAPSWG
jgi:hypothetical protein